MFISLKKLLFESDATTRRITSGTSENINIADIAPKSITDPIGAIRDIANENKDIFERAKKIYNIAASVYTRLGHGSNRSVFDIGGNKVLKVSYVPKTESGLFNIQHAISQTETEAKGCQAAENKGMLPALYEAGPDGLYLILEKAEKVTEKEIADYFGFKNFEEFIKAFNQATHGNEQMENKFSDWLKIMKNCNYDVGDMIKIDNWGKKNDGTLVMVDTGLSIENQGVISREQREMFDLLLKNKPEDVGTAPTILASLGPQPSTAR